MALDRRTVSVMLNGAEYLELVAAAERERLSLPALIRLRCGLPAWMARGAERSGRENQVVTRHIANALDRVQVLVRFSGEEMVGLREKARVATGMLHFAGAEVQGLNLPQYIRTVLGFHVRWYSNPGSDTRQAEADDAWERLQRLGLEPEKYFAEPGLHPDGQLVR